MDYKVSIVVPIYKVEKYIDRCINSLINQTYSNLEIILVDDGSPDNCGKIADKYAKQDNRVISIHKENGGLSDARNYGVKYITGEYTLFVDSDDYLDENAIQTMIDKITEFDGDIVQLGFYYDYGSYLLFDDRYYKENEEVILDNQLLMKELVINKKVKNFAWGKLYKTSLIKHIPFKKGVLFEDVFWAHHVMEKVNKYIILNKPMFYYLQREDSIVGNYNIRNTDIIKGLLERHEFLENKYNYLLDESYKIIFKTCLVHYSLLEANKNKENAKEAMYNIKKYINKEYKNIKYAVKNDKDLLNQLMAFNLNPKINQLYIFFIKVLKKIRLLKADYKLKKIQVDKLY